MALDTLIQGQTLNAYVIGPFRTAAPLTITYYQTLTEGQRVPLTILRFCDYYCYFLSISQKSLTFLLILCNLQWQKESGGAYKGEGAYYAEYGNHHLTNKFGSEQVSK